MEITNPEKLPFFLIAEPVAYFEESANAKASGSLSFTYDNANAIDIPYFKIHFDPTSAKLTPEIKINADAHTNIKSTIKANADLSLTGTLRVGPEIVVKVNGIPLKIFSAAKFVLKGDVSYSNRCLKTKIEGGLGFDAGFGASPLPQIPSPGDMAGAACQMANKLVCNLPNIKELPAQRAYWDRSLCKGKSNL